MLTKRHFSTLGLFFFLLQIHAQDFTSSNLPIVLITTDIDPATGAPRPIVDEPKTLATMKIIYRPDGGRNNLTDVDNTDFLDYEGRIGIEFRGSSSQFLPKKPYGLTTLKDDDDSNNNVEILGMPKENDWILNSLAFDKSLVRDYISYNLARNIGDYAARGRYCELVVNGDYKGLYMIMEKIKVDSDRIDIEKIEEDDNELPQLSGGYFTKIDRPDADEPAAWSYETTTPVRADFVHGEPKPDEVTPEQNKYIKAVFDDLQVQSQSQNTSISNGYPSIIDVPSFVDFILLNELASNVDAYQLSTYFHKDRGGKLRAGPVWDFNLTYGNDLFVNDGDGRSRTDVWQFDNADNVGPAFFKNLFDNPTFSCYLNRRWSALTATGQPLDINAIYATIDEVSTLLNEARARENERWGTLDGYEQEIGELKAWLQDRYNWIDGNLGGTGNCEFPITPQVVISKINYHPADVGDFDDDDLEFIALSNNSDQEVVLTGIYFSALGINYRFAEGSVLPARGEIYLASDTKIFEQVNGFAPFGEYTRDLSNKSQQIRLSDAFGNVIDDVTYEDDNPWPSEADGDGAYLVLNGLDLDNSDPFSWSVSTASLGIDDIADVDTNTFFYPNPATARLIVENRDFLIKNIEIFDLLGRRILQKSANSDRVEVGLETLSSSQYLIKATLDNDTTIIKKIVVR